MVLEDDPKNYGFKYESLQKVKDLYMNPFLIRYF